MPQGQLPQEQLPQEQLPQEQLPPDPGGRLYLGWQFATPYPDPGPPPRKPAGGWPAPVPPAPVPPAPVPPASVPPSSGRRAPDRRKPDRRAPAGRPPDRPTPDWPAPDWQRPDGPAPGGQALVSGDWVAAQRREENLISRPSKLAAVVAVAAAVALGAAAAAGWVPGGLAAAVGAACLLVAGRCGYSIWRGEQVLRARIAAEKVRAERFRADADLQLASRQRAHAERVRQWQRQRAAFTTQKRWYAVRVPDGIDRVDVAGGTLAGWSALLTMSAAYRLATGGEATVIDLSGGAVAADLAGLAAAGGLEPAVWVLPRDLPRLDLADSLAARELAEVLALAASAAEERSSVRDLAVDTAILDRLTGVLDPGGLPAPRVSRIAAALRVLAQVGDPRADLAAGLLTEHEASAIGALFGQGVRDRVVLERALGLEAQLRTLASAGSAPVPLPRGRLRVIALDRAASPQTAVILASFVVAALTQLIGRVPAAAGPASWRHPVFLLGAERLSDDVLDRFTDACESSRSGLVLGYRSLPPHVRQRIGRGNAAVAFMRLGNAADAKAASEQLGTAHRFVLSQLTETVGTSVTDTAGASYTRTVGDSASAAGSVSVNSGTSAGTGRSAPDGLNAPPFGGGSRTAQSGTSRGTAESLSMTEGISTSTAWGRSTSRATGDSEALARSLQRSRELVVEPAELQRLPPTAMIVSYGAGAGRHVLLADANPAIGALPVATLAPLAEAPEVPEGAEVSAVADVPGAAGASPGLAALRVNGPVTAPGSAGPARRR